MLNKMNLDLCRYHDAPCATCKAICNTEIDVESCGALTSYVQRKESERKQAIAMKKERDKMMSSPFFKLLDVKLKLEGRI